jgi:hypothetical protein
MILDRKIQYKDAPAANPKITKKSGTETVIEMAIA